MLTIQIINDGTGDRFGSYDYDVLVDGRIIAQGHVTGHDRLKGWPDLIHLIGNDGNARERAT